MVSCSLYRHFALNGVITEKLLFNTSGQKYELIILFIVLEGCVFPKGVNHLVGRCSLPYSFDNEDEGYYEAGWVPMNKSKIEEIRNDKWFKSPWSYKTAWQLEGTPYWGYFHTYWAGGK